MTTQPVDPYADLHHLKGHDPFELTDEQWALVEDLFDPPGRLTRRVCTAW